MTPSSSGNGISLTDNGSGGISLSTGGSEGIYLQDGSADGIHITETAADGAIEIATSGGNATHGITLQTQTQDTGGINLTDNGSGGIGLTAAEGISLLSESSGIGLNAQGTGTIIVETTGGGATTGIDIQTQATDTGGITIEDTSSVGLNIFGTKVAIGNHGTASGNDSVAIGDSGIAYSADQTVVASTNADALGLGHAQYSVVVGEAQTVDSGEAYLNTCIGPVLLTLVDEHNAAVFNRTIRVHAAVVARRIDTPGTDSAWQADGVLRGDGSSSYTWIGGDPTFTVIAQDGGASSWTVNFAVAGGSPTYLQVSVSGDDVSTINWECTLTLDEVAG